jgi:alpha-tubulin suppressor-like RCC1 family protein
MRRIGSSALAIGLALSVVTVAQATAAPRQTTTPAAVTASGFTPVSPKRVLDTRIGGGPVGPAQTVTIDLSAAVPASTTAVVMNVTGTGPTTSTVVTAYPSGTARPTASNLNLVAGETRANLVTVAVGADRKVVLHNNSGSVHLLADLTGHYGADATGKFSAASPNRVMDTRTFVEFRPPGPLGPGAVETLDLSGKVPASATAVTFTLTGTAATTSTFVTAWPTGSPRPTASNLNLAAGATTPNQVVVALGADRKVNLYNKNGSTHLIVDLAGFYTPDYGALFTPVTPKRVLDTRGSQPVAAAGTRDVTISPLPALTTGVVLNLTGTQPTASTVVTAWPPPEPRPTTSNLNLARGQTAASLVTVGMGDKASVRLFNNSGTVHLIADMAGYFSLPPFSCADGCVYAWGDNAWGVLGTGSYNASAAAPALVYGLSDVVALSDGTALKADGTVWAWGHNFAGQLGNGWSGYGAKSVFPVPVLGLTDVVAIDEALALKSDGTVWAWGDLPGAGRNVPAQVPGLTGVTAVASGPGTAYALKSDGTVWTWGNEWDGTAEPVQVAGLADVRQVEVGLYNVYALIGDGTVLAWGDNRQGQTGNGTVGGVDCIDQSPRPENCWFDEPRPVTGLTGVTSIGADAGHGFAVTADGRAWSWGSNYRGGLGQGLDCDCPSGTPAPIAGLTNARTITGFQDGGYALDADGRVWAWGDNEEHALGETDGTQPGEYSTVPVRLTAPTGVTAVAGGLDAGFALVP